MGWNAQDIEKLRKQNNGQKSTAGTGQSAAPKSTTAPARSSGSTGWSAEKIDALRTGSGTKPAAKSTDAWVNRSAGTSVRSTAQKAGTQSAGKRNQNPTSGSLSAQVLGQTQSVQTTKKAGSRLPTVERTGQPEWLGTGSSTPAWTGGTRKVLGTVSADELGKQVLADMTGNTGSPVATDRQEDYEPDWNYVGSDNTPKQRAIAQGTYGSYAKAAQKVGNTLAKDRQTDRFDELNQWMDESPRHREVVDLLRQKEYTTQEDKGVAPEQAVQVTSTKQKYSPGDLLKMGYTAKEINEARAYIREYDALPLAERAARRTADTTKGIAATVASAVPMAGEMTTQGVKDIRATQKNEAALDKELESDARGKELKDLITAVDMDYNPQYTDEDLRGMGYNQSEIDTMRSRIAGTVQKTALDKDTSLGYQLYNYGQQRTAAAQAGMSQPAKTAMGIATSAAENLAVAGISPALVLPVLSAQGGAEAMGQSIDKGESAGKTLAGGLAKFGAGWAINSVGAADLARTMGSDYAKDTLAGKLADVVRSVADNGVLAQQYPTVANAISGGIDNAMQAFVETYADKAIDAALGDAQAAEEMFSRDTFLQALESGLSGGASGALGGAVGTQLGRMSAALEAADGQTVQRNEPSPSAQGADSSPEWRALGDELPQSPAGDSSPERASLGLERQTEAQTMQSSNPAVQQLAEAMDSGTLTSRTIKLFAPNAANEANRAAFAEAYGMKLPETAAQTRQVLRQMEAERSTAQSAQEEQQAPEAVKQEQTGEQQGSGREIRDGVMTTWNPDGPVETQVLDPEMAARAQAE